MSKREIATEIVENMLDLDLLNTVDYTPEAAKTDAIETIVNMLADFILIKGEVIQKEPLEDYDYTEEA